jgi:hypothetical protein
MAGAVAQGVEHLPSKGETLNSNASTKNMFFFGIGASMKS